MSDSQNNQQKHECKCEGSKQLNALKKEIAELKSEMSQVYKEIAILRKAVRK